MGGTLASECGMKHFRLGCWIIGIVMVCVLATQGGALAINARAVNALEPRVRVCEAVDASRDAQLIAMQRTLERIERILEKHSTP